MDKEKKEPTLEGASMNIWYRKNSLAFHPDKLSNIEPEPNEDQKRKIDEAFKAVQEIKKRYDDGKDLREQIAREKELTGVAREAFTLLDKESKNIMSIKRTMENSADSAIRDTALYIPIFLNLINECKESITRNPEPENVAKALGVLKEKIEKDGLLPVSVSS